MIIVLRKDRSNGCWKDTRSALPQKTPGLTVTPPHPSVAAVRKPNRHINPQSGRRSVTQPGSQMPQRLQNCQLDRSPSHPTNSQPAPPAAIHPKIARRIRFSHRPDASLNRESRKAVLRARRYHGCFCTRSQIARKPIRRCGAVVP